MLESLLRDIGLTSYETKVYVALLELREASVGQILDEAGIHSGKIYQILESLKRKGFAAEVEKNGVRRFFPADPEAVREYIEKKKAVLAQQEMEYTKLLPQLLAKVHATKLPTHIEVFTGYAGMKLAFKKEIDRYRTGREVLVNGERDVKHYDKKLTSYFGNSVFPARVRQRVKVRKILGVDARKNPVESVASVRYLPNSSLVGINVIDDLTIISMWSGEPIIITVESQEVAKNFREHFEVLWKAAKK